MRKVVAVSRRQALFFAASFSTAAALLLVARTPTGAAEQVAQAPAPDLAGSAGAGVAPVASGFGAAAVAAFRRGDLDETTRLFHRAGRDAVAAALTAADRTAALAAAWATETRAEPWPLPLLAGAAASADRRRALAATRAALAISTRLDPELAAAEDLDGATLASWQADWLAQARRATGWIDVRSDSLEVAALLGQVARSLGAPVPAPGEAEMLGALADPDPAIRRAAVELFASPLSSPVRAELARLVAAEAEGQVARAAAGALCAELTGAPSQALIGDVLRNLGPEGLTRARQLARTTHAAGAAEVALARCLVADDSAESRAALRALGAAASGPVRRALASVERGARGDR